MGFTEPYFADRDEDLIRQALASGHRNLDGITFEVLKDKGWMRLNIPAPFAPYAEGGFGTPSGRCELFSPRVEATGLDPLPTYLPPR